MKTTAILFLFLAAILADAQEFLNLGTTANDGTGDKLRAAGIKINTNAYNFDRRLDGLEAGAFTNKWNAWQFWCDPVETNVYHAENRGLGIKTNSVDFAALLQSVLNRGTEGFSFKFEPNPFFTNAYVISNTVIVTNWGTWSGDLAGNPTVAFRAALGFTGPLFQVGAYGMQIGGISGWRDIRFEGDQGATNCSGVELRNVVEPVFAFCEFTGFKAAGIKMASTNAMYWTYVDNCWFVQKWDSSQAIAFAATPIENPLLCHFRITGCTFGGTAGNGIIVSNWIANVNISGNKFFGTAMNDGIRIYAGEKFKIANNSFQNLLGQGIYFYDQGTATNFNSSVTDNDGNIILGDNVRGVLLSGNNAGFASESLTLVGNNGPNIVNFDSAELRLGFLAHTNRALYADSEGRVKPSAGVTQTELEFLDGVTSAIQTQLAAKQNGSFILTNFVLMGISNIVSANANTVITTNSGVLTLTTASGGSGSTNMITFAAGSGTVTNGLYLGLGNNGILYGRDHANVSYHRVFAMDDNEIVWGTNGLLHSFRGTEVSPLLDNTTKLGDAAFRWSQGHFVDLSAQSFTGTGTGVPIIKLQTMMSSDNAFAITVDTNYFGLTNTFNFTNLAIGQQMRVKSVSNGNPTWEVPQLISGVQTNTTSVQADWTGAEMIHITNSLIANVVIIPTNMIGGRSLRVIAQASTQTYTLSVSNAAGTVVLYPFATTNGGSAYTVTNGQTVELDLLSLNGKIHAAMGRFQ